MKNAISIQSRERHYRPEIQTILDRGLAPLPLLPEPQFCLGMGAGGGICIALLAGALGFSAAIGFLIGFVACAGAARQGLLDRMRSRR